MQQKQKSERKTLLLNEKKTILLYSAYLAIGSVSLFASLVALNTAYQAVIWSYSQRYILNSMTLSFALFVSGALLIVACVKLVQKRHSARLFGFVGIGLLIAYSLFVLFIDRYIAYSIMYVLILLILFAVIVAGAVFFISNKRS
jgi:hypothetical protein